MKQFLGLEHEAASGCRARIIPVPFDGTCSWLKGARLGPDAIIEASGFVELYDLETNSEPCRIGVETCEPITSDDQADLLTALQSAVGQSLDQSIFPVVIGGEHSISLGAIIAASSRFPELGILQFDAHTDLRESYEGNPYSHASIMRRVLDHVKNITAVGIRSMDSSELDAAKSVHIFQAADLSRGDLQVDRIVSSLPHNVYVTFDLDAFDPSIMPATGTPEPGGLLWYDTLEILRAVFERKNIVGCDVVELSPLPGTHAASFLAAKLIYKFLAYKFHLK